MKPLFLAYIVLIVHFSLYPWAFSSERNRRSGQLRTWQTVRGRRDAIDVAANVWLYVPFGFIGGLSFPRLSGWKRARLLGLAAGLALAVEAAQQWTPGRYPSLRDVAMNMTGTALGLWVAALAAPWWVTRRDGARSPQFRGDPLGLALLLLWTAAQWFPFMPQIRRAALGEAAFRLSAPGPWPEAAETFASLLLISYLLRVRLEVLHWRLLLSGAAMMLTLRFAWDGGFASGGQVVGAWAGVALSIGWLSKQNCEPKVLAGLALTVLTARQFYPFDFSGPPADFLWTPFQGFLEAGGGAAIRVTAGKAFFYAGSVWLLGEAGCRPALALAAVAVLLGTGEAAQRFLPGRVPEVTDVLIALGAGAMVWHAGRRP